MATILAYARIGAVTLGVLTGFGNQSKLEGMANTRLLEELEFRKHNPIYYKDEHGHYMQTTGHVNRTVDMGSGNYSYQAAGHGHGH